MPDGQNRMGYSMKSLPKNKICLVYAAAIGLLALSVTLGMNPNTVQKAILELDRLGVVFSSPGRGVFVAENAVQVIRERTSGRLTEMRELACELARAGIDREEILRAVADAYDSVNSK